VKAGLEKLLNKDVNEYVSQETVDKRVARLQNKLDVAGNLNSPYSEIQGNLHSPPRAVLG
jgi:hypothetical protein